MEFVQLNFFPTYNPTSIEEEDYLPQLPLEPKTSINSHSTAPFSEDSSSHNLENSENKKKLIPSSSENHNMVKQLIITMRQMLGKFVCDIGCSHNTRQIIAAVWKVFQTTKSHNKDILRAMFNIEVNNKLIDKAGLSSIVSQYGKYEYLNAMEELRSDIVLRMRSENLKTHLFSRNISKKDRLTAYIQYFVEEQLRKGKISSRFNDAASKRMNEILETNKSQDQSIDCYFSSSNEVYDRFTSPQETY